MLHKQLVSQSLTVFLPRCAKGRAKDAHQWSVIEDLWSFWGMCLPHPFSDGDCMKRLSAIAAIAVGSMMLAGCESQLDRNTHLCGLYAARAISLQELESKLAMTKKFDLESYGDSGWL